MWGMGSNTLHVSLCRLLGIAIQKPKTQFSSGATAVFDAMTPTLKNSTCHCHPLTFYSLTLYSNMTYFSIYDYI